MEELVSKMGIERTLKMAATYIAAGKLHLMKGYGHIHIAGHETVAQPAEEGEGFIGE